ncbi:hypothetical protein Q4566_06005 [Tamlana sp. 2_MG-2023]|uniref:hypothetical protein n=1 Tax=unclassified Tamlana TaxID=2614803 RepID=UPI0026E28F27|nr:MULTISPECIES: hypothetical protein [unclassified Tamlana]MDO6759748.1 hypothetical protein [Tamlana sp. 2_MG-2023]MDO6791371.1 hypothetical protein [Tamlana sp. 1_MG-2023]
MTKDKKGFINRWHNIIYMWKRVIDTLPESYIEDLSPRVPIKKIKLVGKTLVADFLRMFKASRIPQSKIWFLILSENNIQALKATKEQTPHSIYVTYFRFRSSLNANLHTFSLGIKFLYDLIYPLTWFKFYLNDKVTARRFYDMLFTVNGTYEASVRLLKKKKPQAIVFTNDHMVTSRSLLLAANHLGIHTYYIQHASVTNNFPPLEFIYALLEGDDALNKYKACGEVKSEVYLVGMPKFDSYANCVNTNDKLEILGVAYNLIDDLEFISKFLVQLMAENPNLTVVARAHPADQRVLPIISGVEISNPKEESAFEFLNRIDGLVASDSSIHLEAVLVNVYPCYYTFGEGYKYDSYGYISQGLVEDFKTMEALSLKLQELSLLKPNIQHKATYYNASIGKDFYGKSALKCSEIILKTLKA